MKGAAQLQISATLVKEYTLALLELMHKNYPKDASDIEKASYLYAIGHAYGALMAAANVTLDAHVLTPVVGGHDLICTGLESLAPAQRDAMIKRAAVLLSESLQMFAVSKDDDAQAN